MVDAAAVATVASDVATFEAAVAFVIDHLEGGDQIVTDTGGVTKYGLSQRAFPTEDIRALTRERAAVLYRQAYWQRLRCYDMPPAVALAVFDAGVNLGTVQAARLLQRIVGSSDDGVVGPQTLQAVRLQVPHELAARLCAARCRYYRELAEGRPGIYRAYWDGWNARVCKVAVECGRWSARA